ncbi:MAG: glycosyltransferase family 2 protein [Planctomycetota bacterium]|nr:glycosyltransferase family 2 protein [Planctomycetota bacterium]MCX8039607.1 glycosyltransferase family 2 protein [Planctomycetota bacterium]MDW8373102.1 glycosyltransferase family 2 protein [Planctomycetota bacterium]
MPDAALPVSVIVLARNEAARLGPCLQSAVWAAERLVIDSGSSDGTPAIAAAHGARVVAMGWHGFGRQRQLAEQHAAQPWICMLDADERCSAALIAELRVRWEEWERSGIAAVSFPRRTWYMGRPLRWYRPFARDRVLRLYRRGSAQWSDDAVHERLRCAGPVARASGWLEHHSYPTVTEHLRKAARYVDLWAEQRRGRAARTWLIPLALPVYLLRDLVWRLGICDGTPGVIAACITALSSALKRARLAELAAESACASR